MSMFCYQCQEAAKGEGCTVRGVCGKTSSVANLQDLMIYSLKGISLYSIKARKLDVENERTNKFVMDALFNTITNANFDEEFFIDRIKEAFEVREEIKNELSNAGGNIDEISHDAAVWYSDDRDEILKKSMEVGVLQTENEDVRSLRELITYGIKGMAAYNEHAHNLGYEDNSIHAFMQKALAATLDDSLSADDLVALTLKTGEIGVKTMALLDEANTSTYGNPEITKVNIGTRNNPGILVSGHDLKDFEELLKQTEGTGVDVYTHSEMLPANYYPAFKKYDHFVGNYGNAWWKQDKEFESFNGPILMTTNCLVPPKSSYKDRVYVTGAVGFDGLTRIPAREEGKEKDFSQIIEHAKKCEAPTEIEKGEIVGGFAHNQVIQLADKVVDAVKTGAIKRFFVMAGCDGRMKSRDYY
ncbi:hydroxylamine reductase, partial [Clostridium sp. D2Q-11]